MKGMVFTMLSDLVENEFGIDVWDTLIEQTNPDSAGIYTSVEVYPDSELLAYVTALSAHTNIPAPDLVFAFGKYLVTRFAEIHPEFFEGHDAKSFLQSVDQQIHVEVRKLHPGVVLPEFQYEDPGPGELLMHYYSPRKLCKLAEGLIFGAGEHFGTDVALTHQTCMLDGADHCEFHLHFEAAHVNAAA